MNDDITPNKVALMQERADMVMRGEEVVNITPSCGCVFCDINLPRERVQGIWGHRGQGIFAICCAVRL